MKSVWGEIARQLARVKNTSMHAQAIILGPEEVVHLEAEFLSFMFPSIKDGVYPIVLDFERAGVLGLPVRLVSNSAVAIELGWQHRNQAYKFWLSEKEKH